MHDCGLCGTVFEGSWFTKLLAGFAVDHVPLSGFAFTMSLRLTEAVSAALLADKWQTSVFK
jgi:hypothetical protein